jgi:molybdopterin molybdotransferase
VISVEEAQKIILSRPMHLGEEKVHLADATGRVLSQVVLADRNFPPYDRVTMDGIAIAYAPYARGRRAFRIAGTGAAGAVRETLSDPEECIEIMTGAMIPVGADTVVRYEDIELAQGVARILVEHVKQGKNIHRQGTDKVKGEILVNSGTKITAAEIGIAATVGLPELNVLCEPRICLVSTGDELVPVDERPLPHQIRSSNVHSIASALRSIGHCCDLEHLPDDKEHIEQRLGAILKKYDVVVLSGGVSKGKFDFIPDALTELGVTRHFHKVRQRPGMPFWFGTKEDATFVFALPGNPVSCLMGAVRYLIPWIRHSQGLPPVEKYARLTQDVTFKPDLMYMLHGRTMSRSDAMTDFIPIHSHGSGDLASLTRSNGFIELPQGKDLYRAGDIYRCWVW